MKKKQPMTVSRFLALSDAKKEAVYQECERIDPLEPGRPLSAAQRKRWQQAKRRGRPAKAAAERAARVLITMPPDLLKKADAYAKEHGLTRAALFTQSIRALVA
ncbi:MAG: hypothetical protein ACHRHE_19455 [Tepidisphaerales bacterium]